MRHTWAIAAILVGCDEDARHAGEATLRFDTAAEVGHEPVAPARRIALRLTADPDAAGWLVDVTTTLGTVTPAAVTLATAPATEQVEAFAVVHLDTPAAAGTATVTARRGELRTEHAVKFHGPPAIEPAGALLYVNEALEVSVSSPDAVACEHHQSSRITVEQVSPALTYRMTADSVAKGQTVALTCRDAHGQQASATFTAFPPL